MQFVVYILFSTEYKKNYVGYTSDLINRMKSHNKSGHDWTKKFRPWIVIQIEFYENKIEAMKREKYFKSVRGLYRKKEIINGFIENNSDG